jgi:hypothetical protein
MPDPGEGIASGDDPITFKAKMDSVTLDLEKAAARYQYYLKNGLATDPEKIARMTPLDSMRIAVNPETGERLIEINGELVTMQ